MLQLHQTPKLDRLVSFVDLAPTMLSLTGIKIPDYMQGKAFLGKQEAEPSKYVHLFSDRMDERYDKVRAIRDKQFRYIKNYMPHRIYGEHIAYLWRAPSSRAWEEAYKNGVCNEVQSVFWNKKPAEELYDITKDPWEVNNLANDQEYKDVLDRLRMENNKWMDKNIDSGLIPEGTLENINTEQSIYSYTHSNKYPFKDIKYAADLASIGDKSKLKEVISFLSSENAVIRYWGVLGCLILEKEALPAKKRSY